MILNEALRAWVEDDGARARTAAATEQVAREMLVAPQLVQLDERLAIARERGGWAVLSEAQAFLDDADALEACLALATGPAKDDDFYRPPLRTVWSEIHSGLILYDRPELSIFLAVLSPDGLASKRMGATGPTSISFSGRLGFYRFLRAGNATLSFWECPAMDERFTAAGAGACRMVERRRICDGETVRLDGCRQSFVIEHADSDLVYLQALTPLDGAPLRIEYDSETLSYVGASSADDVGSRIGMMLTLLRAMDRADAAPLFEQLVRTAPFHARWHAMREFLALNAEAALPHLRAMAAFDPHPEVRAAAVATLAAVTEADPSPKERVLCHV